MCRQFNEIAVYFAMADADTVRHCADAYKHDKAKAQQAAAGCAYILAHYELPSWHRVIERFEIIDDAILFIHATPCVN